MKTLDLADTGRLAEELKSGETIELMADGRAVATVVPFDANARLEARARELEAQGLVRRGSGLPLPDSFFTERLPSGGEGVLAQLLRDRDKE